MKLKKPTLLLNKEICIRNIQRMKAKADKNKLRFRPHFKTHQSAAVGEWFREAGTNAITVSSVSMAKYFAANGWDDITIAFPVNLAEIEEINQLATNINLNLLIADHEVVKLLAAELANTVGIYLKVDTGYHRSGILVEYNSDILKLILNVQDFPLLQFKGLLVHNGHTYKTKSRQEIKTIHQNSLEKLVHLKKYLQNNQIDCEISMGDTPTMSVIENFDGIDEIRPGNFVFYDVMQVALGACMADDIAVAMACPVVAKHMGRKEIVIYGGAIHLSKDFIQGDDGSPIYGKIVLLNENGWGNVVPETYVKSVSQEHGIIKVNADFIDKVMIGDFIGVLPVHSCLAVNLMREYYTLNGEKIETMNS